MNHPHSITLATIVLVSAAALAPAQVQKGIPEEEALRILGRAPGSVSGIESGRVRLPNLGITVTEAKALDPVTGEVVSSAVDQDGRPADLSALRRLEIDARRRNPAARIDAGLDRRMADEAPAVVPVVVWLEHDAGALDALNRLLLEPVLALPPDDPRVRVAEETATRSVLDHVAAITAPFARFLRAEGIEVTHVSITAPAVFARIPAAALAAVAALPGVDTIYLDDAQGGDSNADANATHRTTEVHKQGVRGRGIRAANMGNTDVTNPFLDIVESFDPAGAPTAHGTQVSGCIASKHPDRPGASPDVSFYSANPSGGLGNASITATGDWIITRNIDVTNMSYYVDTTTALQYQDRYFDYQSRNYADSYVTASGNFGTTHGNVVSPSKGWNVITVGNHTDGGNGNWTGDVMNSSSSFVDPATGCDKPNVSANGTSVLTLDLSANGNISGSVSGTSYASPHTAGNLANAMVVNTAIRTSPEAAMALLMATAWHNLEGATRLSDVDGAGGIHGLGAFRAARDNRVRTTTVTPSSFAATGYHLETMLLTGGDRARIVLAWSASADAGYTTSVLDADLDITVVEGYNQASGTVITGSYSYFNNFEILEFTPAATGWFTVRVNDYRFDGASERIGLAWSQKYRDTSAFKLLERAVESSPLTGPTIGNPSYFMDFAAPNSPSATYLCAPSLTPPGTGPGFPISPLTWSPLTVDALTLFWLDDVNNPAYTIWNDSVGTLSSAGTTTSNSVLINGDPGLVGLRLYHIGMTFENGWPDGVKELSEVHTFQIQPPATDKPRSDDGSFVQALPAGFRFYGVTYTQCWVNMNGSITFGGSDSDYTESVAELLAGRPRIAFLWDDLNPGLTGSQGTPAVRVRQHLAGPADQQFVVIEFVNVPGYNEPGVVSTVRVTLQGYSGAIKIEYLDCGLADAIVGLSPGNGLSSANERDFTSSGEVTSGAGQAIFQEFPGCVGFNCDTFDLESPDALHWNVLTFTQVDLFQADNYRLRLDLR